MQPTTNYREFLNRKSQLGEAEGFEPVYLPDWMKDFQASLTSWNIRQGRSGTFADCGLGKTPMQLVYAENCVRHTNRPALILAPLAVSAQTVREANKFGIEAHVSRDGKVMPNITVTNYERLHYFKASDFSCVVCDESSILKNFDGATKAAVTEFMREIPYRLLCTATAAPNDYHELGTSSEALGYLGYSDMLSRFFKEDVVKDYLGWGRKTFRFRGHAEEPFWKWVCSWSRSCRKPSDLGFDDKDFILPELREREIVVECSKAREGMLFPLPAHTMDEQREEARQTIAERCEKAAEIMEACKGPIVAWCNLNDEADYLEKIVKGAKQVSGSMSDDRKEELLLAFQSGQITRFIIKPKIGCFGLNWQHCADIVNFASHSWEQYYQLVRRCWRFGQRNRVNVSIIIAEGQARVMASLRRKSAAADAMFASVCQHMNDSMKIERGIEHTQTERMPQWLLSNRC